MKTRTISAEKSADSPEKLTITENTDGK